MAFNDAIVGQVLERPDATRIPYGLDQLLRDRAGVEAWTALAAELFEGARQLRLAQQVEFVRYFAFVEEDPRCFPVLAHGLDAPARAFAIDPVDADAAAGQSDCRGQ